MRPTDASRRGKAPLPPGRGWTEQPSRIPWVTWGVLVFFAGLIVLGEYYYIKKVQRGVTRHVPALARVPDFRFTSETNTPVTRESLLGQIWIADFIFTRCQGPCPLMTERMKELQVATRTLANGRVRLISVTVDPAHDTPEVLSKYGAGYGTNPDRWSFLTGDPAAVENFITKGMLRGLSKDAEGMPAHAQKFVLVDRFGLIRGYYDLDAPGLVEKLVSDIGVLDRERKPPKPKG